MILLALTMMAAEPSAEALKLGREIAESGTLATLLPMMRDDEIGKMVKDNPSLRASEQAALRRTADRVFAAGADKLFAATARAYAEKLSLDDLKAAAAYARSPAAKRVQAALRAVIGASMGVMQGMDFKKDVAAAYCKESGKLCAAAQ
ncbi:DUF2059 domain-containing protein [Sphingomonas kaistensis]|uniref:DUF2059 domain-containing protein n=1 Tax=Sphingomonas kaistensis TaxID=298708 RepID=A0ABZ2G0T9_9SPHN